MGVPSRNRSLLSSENGVTYASIPRRKAKTAASQRFVWASVKHARRGAILIIASFHGTNIMSEHFTETRRAASEPGWSRAVGHRFVKERR
jgi:hypothetical protein